MTSERIKELEAHISSAEKYEANTGLQVYDASLKTSVAREMLEEIKRLSQERNAALDYCETRTKQINELMDEVEILRETRRKQVGLLTEENEELKRKLKEVSE